MASRESFLKSLAGETTTYLCYSLFIATLGPLQFGFHMAELNAPQNIITCKTNKSPQESSQARLPQCIPMNTTQFALVSSIYTLGGLLGALSAGRLSDKRGRLLCMRLTALIFVIGSMFESLAPDIGLFAFGRYLSGIAAGAAIVVVPIYISELAPPRGKGFFGAFTQVMINLGILIAQFLGYFLSTDDLWRTILASAGGIGVLHFVGLFFIPESPKWLAERENPQQAKAILGRIRAHKVNLDAEVKAWNVDSSPDEISEEESLLAGSLESRPPPNTKQSSNSIGILTTFLDPTYRPAIFAIIMVMLAQQFTGINSIVMYSVDILSALLPNAAALVTVAVSGLNVLISILCTPLPDHIGRKTCLLLSITGMGLSSVLLAFGISHSVKILSAIATLLFVASFAIGLGPVPFILANELVGAEAVGATQSIALAANWTATFVVSQFFPMLNQALDGQGRVFYVFAGFAAVFGLFIAWWVPETKGKHGADEVWGRREVRARVE